MRQLNTEFNIFIIGKKKKKENYTISNVIRTRSSLMCGSKLRTWPWAYLMSSPTYSRALPWCRSWSRYAMKVDVGQTNTSERRVLQALYGTRLLHLLPPNAFKRDALNNRESIWIEIFIRMISNITCNLYPLPHVFHIHIIKCDISYESSSPNVCFYMYANSHIVEVYVFCQDILHPTRGFTSNRNSSKRR